MMLLPQTSWSKAIEEKLNEERIKSKNRYQTGPFDPKFMYTIFFKRSDVVQMSRLNKGKTINHDSYIEETLNPDSGLCAFGQRHKCAKS